MERPAPRLVIAGHVFRSALGWALIWGVVFGIFVISTVKAYAVAYPTLAERIKAVASLQAFAIILGQPYHAETMSGFVMWRVTVAISMIGSVWALLTSTGLLRGDEDAGRWELLLAGPVTKLRGTAEALLGLGGALVVMLVPAALITIATGRLPEAHFAPQSAALFALTLVSGAAMFLAIGALASQVSATRSQAATLSAGIMGGAFLIRMAADSTKGLDWLLWLTPYGWIEKVRPLRDIEPFAFLPIVGLVVGCLFATLYLASRRDLGASVLRERDARNTGGGWLIGPTTLALRLVRGSALAWVLGLAAFSFFTGFVTRSASALLADSPAFVQVLGRLGLRKASEGYLGFTFLMLAVVVAVMAASQMAAVRDEEGAGRLDNLLVRPTGRIHWLAGRTGVVAAIVLAGGLASGFATWLGTESQHTGLPFAKLLEAGLNAAVPGLFVVGAGVLAFGVAPRFTSAATYGIVAYSFIVRPTSSRNTWARRSTDSPTEVATSDSAIVPR